MKMAVMFHKYLNKFDKFKTRKCIANTKKHAYIYQTIINYTIYQTFDLNVNKLSATSCKYLARMRY